MVLFMKFQSVNYILHIYPKTFEWWFNLNCRNKILRHLDHVTSLGTKRGGRGRSGMNLVFRSAAISAISSSSFSNNLIACVKVREPVKRSNQSVTFTFSQQHYLMLFDLIRFKHPCNPKSSWSFLRQMFIVGETNCLQGFIPVWPSFISNHFSKTVFSKWGDSIWTWGNITI